MENSSSSYPLNRLFGSHPGLSGSLPREASLYLANKSEIHAYFRL